MDQKNKINAAISYLFMWELFLLAKKNPSFWNEFVRSHAKNATKIHFSFLLIILVYKYFIDNFLVILIPIINLNLDRLIESFLYLVFTFIIIKWVYRAYNWVTANEIKIRKDYLQVEAREIENNLSETQKILYISSYIPFLWLLVEDKNWITEYGKKIWWIFSLIFILLVISNHSDSVLFLSLIYIAYIVFSWIMIFLYNKVVLSSFISNIYNLRLFYVKVRAFWIYILDVILVIFWKNMELNFEEICNKIIAKDEKYDSLANNYLTNDYIIFNKKLIFIPVLNIIFLPTFLVNKKSRYIISIIQWLLISIIFVILMYFWYSNYTILLLFPIFLWIANINKNPFYRIPVIYEIYELLDKLTFGLFSKIKFLKEKNKESQEVSFKI